MREHRVGASCGKLRRWRVFDGRSGCILRNEIHEFLDMVTGWIRIFIGVGECTQIARYTYFSCKIFWLRIGDLLDVIWIKQNCMNSTEYNTNYLHTILY